MVNAIVLVVVVVVVVVVSAASPAAFAWDRMNRSWRENSGGVDARTD